MHAVNALIFTGRHLDMSFFYNGFFSSKVDHLPRRAPRPLTEGDLVPTEVTAVSTKRRNRLPSGWRVNINRHSNSSRHNSTTISNNTTDKINNKINASQTAITKNRSMDRTVVTNPEGKSQQLSCFWAVKTYILVEINEGYKQNPLLGFSRKKSITINVNENSRVIIVKKSTWNPGRSTYKYPQHGEFYFFLEIPICSISF